jgi:hypothetical protein
MFYIAIRSKETGKIINFVMDWSTGNVKSYETYEDAQKDIEGHVFEEQLEIIELD